MEQMDNTQTQIVLSLGLCWLNYHSIICQSGFWQNVRQDRFVVNAAHLPAFQFPGSTYNPAAFVLPLRKECCLKRHLKVFKKQEIFHIYLHFSDEAAYLNCPMRWCSPTWETIHSLFSPAWDLEAVWLCFRGKP